MDDDYLSKIVFRFPNTNREFRGKFLQLIEILGRSKNRVFELHTSDQNYYPKQYLNFQNEGSNVLVEFMFANGEAISVKLENSTGEYRQSPHSFTRLKIDHVIQKLSEFGISLISVDHVGFNLPWFSSGLHPQIGQLRDKLQMKCLYHQFPTGEQWDFIIPGDLEEIYGHKIIDYAKVRRPKFEIVSFDKDSTPLVQFDFHFDTRYENLVKIFPEALADPEIRNIWIYLESPYGIDVCLVANESSENDWSNFFEGSRI